MKLIKQTKGGWNYRLEETEFNLLGAILDKFPFNDPIPGNISKTDMAPKAKEREKLLKESLAEHRNELKAMARRLLGPEKLQRREKDFVLKMSLDERETLLQILNDIRVGCWHALGQPENLEPQSDNLSSEELANYSVMNVAGYFEHGLLVPEE